AGPGRKRGEQRDAAMPDGDRYFMSQERPLLRVEQERTKGEVNPLHPAILNVSEFFGTVSAAL
ncbi:hypothetical protein, partial [Mesorhizobium sp. M7A.F.Ca.US.007.01.1.1]|uniref:hypothetical protein n=1 Tax=Mesorhizobium sp. M7A.F.Ca.US.007.01.1.1 TaxID=2496712 RepID=UPI0019D152ED